MKTLVGLCVSLVMVTCAGPARALHREDIPVLVRLAHELENRATQVLRAAEAQAHHFTGRETRMLRSLNRFRADVRRFHGGLETYFSNPRQVQNALEDLNDGADRVESVIYRAHALSHVIDDWNRCALLLRRINRHFDGETHALDASDPEHHRW